MITTCPKCGDPIDGGAIPGICTRCFAAGMFETGAIDSLPTTASSGDDPCNFRVPGYQITGIIGRGGMGVVYGARQTEPARDVALKMLTPQALSSPDWVRRFRNEAETVASLDHPYILPVYSVGELSGLPYFTMKRVDGGSLGDRIAEGQFQDISGRQAVEWVLKLAEAVGHAHVRGVLHRDLKPGNVLFDTVGNLYLSDFGLAKSAAPGPLQSDLTQSLAVMGTPAYMSPEVANLGAAQATVATDVYGLGAILYELLAGRPPFQGQGFTDILRLIAEADPAPIPLRANLTDSRSGSARELQAVVTRCLEKDPAHRYPSAEALAFDLRAWLASEPVVASPATQWQLASKWVRRHPALATVGVAAIVTMAAVITGITQSRVARVQDSLRRQFNYVASIGRAHQGFQSTNSVVFEQAMASARDVGQDRDLRGIEWGLLRNMADSRESPVVFRTGQSLLAVAESPDGSRWAVLGQSNLFILDGHGTVIRTLSVPFSRVGADVEFFPDGDRLATTGSGGTFLHSSTNGWSTKISDQPGHLLAISPDSQRLATTRVSDLGWNDPLGIHVFDISTPDSPRLEQRLDNDGLAMQWSANGSKLMIVPRRGGWMTWTVGDSRPTTHRAGSYFAPGGILSRDATLEAQLVIFGVILVTDTASGKVMANWEGFPQRDVRMSFAPDGSALAFSTAGNALIVKTLQSGAGEGAATGRSFDTGHSSEITDVHWLGSAEAILSVSQDGTLRKTGLQTAPAKLEFEVPHQLWIASIHPPQFSPDSRFLLLAEHIAKFNQPQRTDLPGDDVSMIFDLTTRKILGRVPGQPVAWNRDAKILTWTRDGAMNLWDVTEPSNPVARHRFRVNPSPNFNGATLANRGRWILSTKTDDQIHAYDVPTERTLAAIGPEFDYPIGHPFEPMLLLSARTNAVVLQHPLTGWHRTLVSETIADMRFSPSGKYAVVSDMRHGLRVHDARNGNLVAELKGQTAPIMAVAMTPDDRRLIVGSGDFTLAIWDIATGIETIRMKMDSVVSWLAVSPDQRWLVTGHFPNRVGLTADSRGPGTYRIWPIADWGWRPEGSLPADAPDSVWERAGKVGERMDSEKKGL